jgi:hypothetical protein
VFALVPQSNQAHLSSHWKPCSRLSCAVPTTMRFDAENGSEVPVPEHWPAAVSSHLK